MKFSPLFTRQHYINKMFLTIRNKKTERKYLMKTVLNASHAKANENTRLITSPTSIIDDTEQRTHDEKQDTIGELKTVRNKICQQYTLEIEKRKKHNQARRQFLPTETEKHRNYSKTIYNYTERRYHEQNCCYIIGTCLHKRFRENKS
ncbi:hypothetical protein DID74_02445 [Candidatus Marinamargulisbacteria bacterium SCGC AG-333-B06]|nr:hypothetical protein DID74_02445 [Candidatus Marinamargulisbacteria bacterium SCGC AG-333-B06]